MKTSECHLQQIQDWKPNDLRIETFYNHSPYRLFGVVSDKTSVGPRKDPATQPPMQMEVASHHGAGTFLGDGKGNILPSMTSFVGVGLKMEDDCSDMP